MASVLIEAAGAERREEMSMGCLPPDLSVSLDLDEHHDFLPCSSGSMGVLNGHPKETSTGKVEHGTGPLDLLSRLRKRGRDVDKGKELMKDRCLK